MRDPHRFALLLVLVVGASCGKEIGDECVIASDCSPNGDRVCIIDQATQEGYCTVQGCAFNTCPEEAVCVRFFTGSFSDRQCNRLSQDRRTDDCAGTDTCSAAGTCTADPAKACNPLTEDRGCTFDELCSLTAETCTPDVFPDPNNIDPDACGRCVPRSAEIRFCMRTCESNDDCREGYECRDETLMKEHGGEPVRENGAGGLQAFCATAP